MEKERLMTEAQRARKRRYERLRTQYEDILREHPGSTNAQVLEEMARRGCGGMHSSAGIRRALVSIGAIAVKARRPRTAQAAEGGAQ